MQYIIDHIPKTTPHNRRSGIVMIPESITIHSTGNPTSTSMNELKWLTSPQNKGSASWHIVVDEKEAIEAIPLREAARHAGDGNGPGNRTSIGIEICESGNRAKTLQNAVELVADLLKQRNWGTDKLKRHFDRSGKDCPRILRENNWAGWEKFKAEVENKLAPIPAINIIFNGRRANHVTARLHNGRTEVSVSGQWVGIRDIVNLIPDATLSWDEKTKTADVKIP